MTIPLSGGVHPNYGWNYPITVILILAGIIQIMVFKFWMELPLIMDGDILITWLEFSFSIMVAF
jgi:hypothetical protein